MEKKRILFICSVTAKDTQLRVLDEIGVIEPILLSGEMRESFDFTPKLSVRVDTLTKTIIGGKTTSSPYILHFSLHGNREKGLKFVGRHEDACYQGPAYFEDILEEMQLRNQKIKCVLFNVCHSLDLASSVTEFVDYAIGVEGTVHDQAAIEFSRGFYSQLFDNTDENDAELIKKCFRFGTLYIRQWMRDESIEIEDGGEPYDKRFHLFPKPSNQADAIK